MFRYAISQDRIPAAAPHSALGAMQISERDTIGQGMYMIPDAVKILQWAILRKQRGCPCEDAVLLSCLISGTSRATLMSWSKRIL
jgi:hypothetical protein